MKKICLSVIGLYLGILSAFSQETDSSAYKSRKLTLDEVNFVSGYYHQNGNHSAVTGGIGTEKLSDVANTLELRLYRYDRKARKNSYGLEIGVDHYSSASSDKIDPATLSSASSSDTRIYPSLSWTRQNEAKRSTIGLSLSLSNEYDYRSFGAGASLSLASRDNNRELTVRGQVYLDRWKVILPIELRTSNHYGSEPRDSYSASVSLSQIVNPKLQLLFIAEPTYQSGLLATRYQRVYFRNGGHSAEQLPSERKKLPLGVRANYFAGDQFIFRSFYRFYMDDWGVKAHTFELEMPVKLTPFFSVSPFYRYYSQSAADYFAPYGAHLTTEPFFTSDYDLSSFHSQFFGAGLRVAPPSGVLGIQHLNSAELRFGHYLRNDGLKANQLTLQLKFK